MKVITSIKNIRRRLIPGDEFVITLNEGESSEMVFCDAIYKKKSVEYIATYRYADADGTVDHSSLYVSYGDYKDYVLFVSSGKFLNTLSREQQVNFLKTSNIQIKDVAADFKIPKFTEMKRPSLIVQIFNRLLLIINEWAKK